MNAAQTNQAHSDFKAHTNLGWKFASSLSLIGVFIIAGYSISYHVGSIPSARIIAVIATLCATAGLLTVARRSKSSTHAAAVAPTSGRIVYRRIVRAGHGRHA